MLEKDDTVLDWKDYFDCRRPTSQSLSLSDIFTIRDGSVKPVLKAANPPVRANSHGVERVYDAFHLLQTESFMQRMVMALSSDIAVWDVVMNNEVVRKLGEPFYAGLASIHSHTLTFSTLGVSTSCVDLLASVASYPNPDDKIKTTSFKVQAGGKPGNALTCVARLRLRLRLISKVADDTQGRAILQELQADSIDTSFVAAWTGASSVPSALASMLLRPHCDCKRSNSQLIESPAPYDGGPQRLLYLLS
ncbi:hypothetical protein ACFXTO_026891 [Malus domestica]